MKQGIGSLTHYPTVPHTQKAYSGLGFLGHDLALACQLAKEAPRLPMSPHIYVEDAHAVVEALKSVTSYVPMAVSPPETGIRT